MSVVLNIAEAHGRYHYKDRVKFLVQARGSLVEVLACQKIAKRLGYRDLNINAEVKNLRVKLSNFISSVQSKL